jgi:hypothetical protein
MKAINIGFQNFDFNVIFSKTSVKLILISNCPNFGEAYNNKPSLSFRQFNLSLAGCSPAEPVSVSIEHFKYQFIYTIFATCLKRQPLTQ